MVEDCAAQDLIFVYQLLLNRIPVKKILARQQNLAMTGQRCVANCGVDGNIDNLFVKRDFFSRLWPIISNCLGFSTTSQTKLLDHLLQFGGLCDFLKNIRLALNTIWLFVILVIWKERNRRIFHNKLKHLQTLSERVKIKSFSWLKPKYVSFDYDYQFWRLNSLTCLSTVM